MPRMILDMTNQDINQLRRALRRSTGENISRRKLPDVMEALLSWLGEELTRKSNVRITHKDVIEIAKKADALGKKGDDDEEEGEERGRTARQRGVQFEKK